MPYYKKYTFSYLFFAIFVILFIYIAWINGKKGDFMKRIAGKIAMILVLVMLAGSFTGCFTMYAFKEWDETMLLVFPLPLFPALDIVTAPIQLAILIVEIAQSQEMKSKAMEMDNIDTFSSDLNINSIPEADWFSLTEKINSLPEAEISAFSKTVDSLSKTEISAITRAFNNLSEAEILSSMETLNSMPDEMLIAALNNSQYIGFRY